MYLKKKKSDHIIESSDTCGTINEVLSKGDYSALALSIINNIHTTIGHFHTGFDEVYVVASGSLSLEFYDPDKNHRWSENFEVDELCVITRGIHHKVTGGSFENKLMVICVPSFDSKDVHRSEVLESRL